MCITLHLEHGQMINVKNRPHDKLPVQISALVTGAEYTWDIQRTVFHWLLKSVTQDEDNTAKLCRADRAMSS